MARSDVFDQFEAVAPPTLMDILGHLKPAGSPNDPIPPGLFKEVLSILTPPVLSILNGSFANGIVPVSFERAVVTPLIKKPGLDSSVLSNFRPISKLPFLPKNTGENSFLPAELILRPEVPVKLCILG